MLRYKRGEVGILEGARPKAKEFKIQNSRFKIKKAKGKYPIRKLCRENSTIKALEARLDVAIPHFVHPGLNLWGLGEVGDGSWA
jgi:hypothetical protein